MNYWISDEQLSLLAAINTEWPERVAEQEELLDIIRTQILDQDSGD